MFNQLQDRLSNVVKTLRGQGKISEKNVKELIRTTKLKKTNIWISFILLNQIMIQLT